MEPSLTQNAITNQSKEPQNQPIIITGMHKSGTSLTAAMLQAAGMNIGENLMVAGPGNPLGHFEDMDLYALHCDVLKVQGIHMDGWTTQSKVKVPQQFQARAQTIFQGKQASGGVWGWKEPRTTLFLDFWKQAIPKAKFVFVYRKPWEVVDSLFRRGDRIFTQNPRFAIETWMAYNKTLLKFRQRHEPDTFLFDVNCFHTEGASAEKEILKQICEKLNVTLNTSGPLQYQPKALHTLEGSNHRPAVLYKCFPKALKLYNELGASADLSAPQTDYLRRSMTHRAYQDWCFQDWMHARQAQQEIASLQTRLKQAEKKLQTAQADLQQEQHS